MAPGRHSDCAGFHRRDFLRLGTAGLLGLGLADLLRLEARTAKNRRKATGVIMIWLAGGPSTIDMWDLKPAAPANVRGEFRPIATSATGVQICEHLPKLAKVMNRCTLVRSLNHNIPEHDVGTAYMTTGNRPNPSLVYPGLGSLAACVLPEIPGIPANVAFASGNAAPGGNGGFLGPAYNPLEVHGNPQEGRLQVPGIGLPDGFSLKDLANRDRLRGLFDESFRALDRTDLPASLDKFHRQALDILRSDRTRKAFDLDKEPVAVRDRYGRGTFAQSALAARRLIEAGVRFVTIGIGGWDTHANNFGALQNTLLPPIDQTVSALVEDLDARGLLDQTIVYCAGEFNRTPRINSTAGRDHWSRSMAVLLAGGGFPRGHAHGSTDSQGTAPATEPCSPDDVSATLFHHLGIEPRAEVRTTTGRPIALFREGKVIDALAG